jgi:hypothetical protein
MSSIPGPINAAATPPTAEARRAAPDGSMSPLSDRGRPITRASGTATATAGARAQRRYTGEHDRTWGLDRAAGDQHTAAALLAAPDIGAIIRARQGPAAQQLGRDGDRRAAVSR